MSDISVQYTKHKHLYTQTLFNVNNGLCETKPHAQWAIHFFFGISAAKKCISKIKKKKSKRNGI